MWAGNTNSPLTLNHWNYVQGNPVNFIDPTGLLPCPWNLSINACDINDWAGWMFKDIYSVSGIKTNLYISTNSGTINLAGAVTNQYLQDVKPLATIYYSIGETGLNLFPVGAYQFSQAVSGTNLLGDQLSPSDRQLATIFGVLGLGDCFPGLNFAPEGVVGSEIPFPVGQDHHILSNKIFRALSEHEILKGIFGRDDFLVRAATKLDHSGYQLWHRAYDTEVVEWLAKNSTASREEFIDFLREIYGRPALKKAFPNALDILK